MHYIPNHVKSNKYSIRCKLFTDNLQNSECKSFTKRNVVPLGGHVYMIRHNTSKHTSTNLSVSQTNSWMAENGLVSKFLTFPTNFLNKVSWQKWCASTLAVRVRCRWHLQSARLEEHARCVRDTGNVCDTDSRTCQQACIQTHGDGWSVINHLFKRRWAWEQCKNVLFIEQIIYYFPVCQMHSR